MCTQKGGVGMLFHQTGYITDGDMKGFYVKAVQDAEDTGGCYLLFSKDFSDPYAEGYDEWYPTPEDLERRCDAFTVYYL